MTFVFWFNIAMSFWVLVGRIFALWDLLKRMHLPFHAIFTNKAYHCMLIDAGFYGYLTPLMMRLVKGPIPPKRDILEE